MEGMGDRVLFALACVVMAATFITVGLWWWLCDRVSRFLDSAP